MTVESRKWRGRRGLERNREVYQNKILQKLLLAPEGLMRRKELFESVDWHGNKRFFEECVSALAAQKKIVRIESSRKHVDYALVEDDATIQSLRVGFQKIRMGYEELWDICKRSSELKHDVCVRLYEYVLLSEVNGYLELSLGVGSCAERWQNLVKSLIELESGFLALLIELCRIKNQKAFDKASKNVITELDGMKARKARRLLKEGNFGLRIS